MDEYKMKLDDMDQSIEYWINLSNNNEALVQDMRTDCRAHKEENQQLAR
jgi:hypothetical protein